MEVERVVPVEGRIWVGGARATCVSFLFFFLFFCFNCWVCFCMKKRSGIAAPRAERPEDCVDGESVDGEGSTVVRKKWS